jgi:hypothetical protein
VKDRPPAAVSTRSGYWVPARSSKVEVRVVVERLAGPVVPGVQVNVAANELPWEMVTVFAQLIGS